MQLACCLYPALNQLVYFLIHKSISAKTTMVLGTFNDFRVQDFDRVECLESC
jgi:hypothetical protein